MKIGNRNILYIDDAVGDQVIPIKIDDILYVRFCPDEYTIVQTVYSGASYFDDKFQEVEIDEIKDLFRKNGFSLISEEGAIRWDTSWCSVQLKRIIPPEDLDPFYTLIDDRMLYMMGNDRCLTPIVTLSKCLAERIYEEWRRWKRNSEIAFPRYDISYDISYGLDR
jgi:hypothetical protein